MHHIRSLSWQRVFVFAVVLVPLFVHLTFFMEANAPGDAAQAAAQHKMMK